MASTDPFSKLDAAKEHLAVPWTADRAAAVERALLARRRVRARARVSVAALVVLLAGAMAWRTTRRATGDDGVRITAVGPVSQVELLRQDGATTAVALREGAARFEVQRRPGRKLLVHAEQLEVSSFETRFLMEQVEGGTRLAVEQGELEVRWKDGHATLQTGQSGIYPPPPAPVVPRQPPPKEEGVAERRVKGAAVPPSPQPPPAPKLSTWQTLAREGDFDKAYDQLHQAPEPPRDEPAELLLAADVARLSGHPDDALPPLEQVSAHHADDPRAPLAAFTLGRVLLDELGRPREAADAFALARELSPSSPLSEDALAREVEAWSRAGDSTKAKQLAQQYLELYPQGQRARAVRYHGGLQ